MSEIIRKALDSFLSVCPLAVGEVVGVGVSGGADSLCLVLSLAELARARGFRVRAVTVDHGLRPESADEAAAVAERMRAAGVPHETLVWTGAKPRTRIEEKAREKRYEMMLNWCRKEGIGKLFTAHHAGDQAETFWARLARGSGVDGLSAMAPVRRQSGIDICRPFLSVDKEVLKQELFDRGIAWAEDGMNADEAYERVRWRHRQAILSDMGLTPAVIGRTADRLRRARAALDFYADRFCAALVYFAPVGYAVLPAASFDALPLETQIRVMQRVLTRVGGDKDVSLEALERYILGHPIRMTLGGCLLVRRRDDLFVAREVARMAPAAVVPAFQKTAWDRFWIWAACPVCVGTGKAVGYDALPHAIRCSVPNVSADEAVSVHFFRPNEKELEKSCRLDYKKETERPVYIWMKEDEKD